MTIPDQTIILARLRALGEKRDRAAASAPRVFDDWTFKLEKRDGSDMPTLVGHGAVFNRLSDDLWGFREKVNPGAFIQSLAEDDAVCCINHLPAYVLGRVSARTLRLAEDAFGLLYEDDLPATTYARDLIVSVERGDVRGCSFWFEPQEDAWDYSDPDYPIRTLLRVKLRETGPCLFPAYPETDCSVRSEVRSEVRALALALRTAPAGHGAAPGAGQEDPLERARILRRKVDLEMLF